MMGRVCFRLGLVWLLLQAATAYPALVWGRGGASRQLWWASAAALVPLLRNLGKFAVAAPAPGRKMPSVEPEILRRMGLTLALAGILFFLEKDGLGAAFWVGLVAFYQLALVLDTGLLLHQWNTAPAPAPGSSPPPA